MTDQSLSQSQLQSRTLIVHTDGGSRSNPGPAAYGVAAFCGDFSDTDQVGGEKEENTYEVAHFSKYLGVATNNEAEYQGLISGLRELPSLIETWKPQQVIFRLDSQLVIEQVMGRWKVKQASLQPFVQQARELLSAVSIPIRLEYVPRALNARADTLVNECLDSTSQF